VTSLGLEVRLYDLQTPARRFQTVRQPIPGTAEVVKQKDEIPKVPPRKLLAILLRPRLKATAAVYRVYTCERFQYRLRVADHHTRLTS
jgi:hypothetical protein